MFSCEYCKIFKNTYFQKHLRTAASETYGSEIYKEKLSLSQVFITVFFSFRNNLGKEVRNKSLYISSSIFLTCI